jgi:sialate O-acetylesterase
VKHRNDIEVRFNHAEKGLLVKPGGAGTGFQIAGADRIFKNATVRVQGNRLFASNPDVKSPQAIRYAFTNAPEATLFNGVGLPAPSFRSDDWEH